MMGHAPRSLTILLALLVAACGKIAQGKEEQVAQSETFELGTQGHFGQNWQPRWMQLTHQASVRHLRDGISWESAERRRGFVELSPQKVSVLQSFCETGGQLLLTSVPQNPLYDGGNVVTSAEGHAAFLTYLEALAAAFPDCIAGFEIGNEINAAGALPTNDGEEGAAAYVNVLKAIYAPLKASNPDIAVLGGSTNVIGTGFLIELFDQGMLDVVDGIAVHPYRNHAENLDWELQNLIEEITKRGETTPIWATEFGDEFGSPELAAPALLKLTTIMAASGIERAYWYAMVDQAWFKNMGLFDKDENPKPAAQAFDLVQRELLSLGRPEKIATDPLLFLYQFGQDRWVVWGALRPLQLAAGTKVLNSVGEAVSPPREVTMEPLILIGPQPEFLDSSVAADSLLQFGGPHWEYSIIKPSGDTAELEPMNGTFATRLANRWFRPAFVSDIAAAATVNDQGTVPVSITYTADRAFSGTMQICVYPRTTKPIGLTAAHAGQEILNQQVSKPEDIRLAAIELAAPDKISLVFSPLDSQSDGHRFTYRIRLFNDGAIIAECGGEAAGWGREA